MSTKQNRTKKRAVVLMVQSVRRTENMKNPYATVRRAPQIKACGVYPHHQEEPICVVVLRRAGIRLGDAEAGHYHDKIRNPECPIGA